MWNVDNNSKLRIVLILTVLAMILPVVTSYRWEQRIDITNVEHSTTSTNYTPTSGGATIGTVEIDLSKYDYIKEIYYEVTGEYDFTGIPNGVGSGRSRLYDLTNNINVSGSEVYLGGSPAVKRSGNLSYLFNNPNIQIMMQAKAGSSSTAKVYSARLVIVQDGNITKTRTYIPVGASLTESDSCVETPEDEITEPKKWNWSNNDFVSNINVTFHATHKSTDSITTSVKLINSTSNIAILSTSNTTFVYSKSGNLSLGNDILSVGICRLFGSGSSYLRNAYIVVDQDGIDINNPKTLTIFSTDIDLRQTSLETPQADNTAHSYYNDTNFGGISRKLIWTSTMKQTQTSPQGTVFSRLEHGNNDEVNNSNISITSNNFTHIQSMPLTDELLGFNGVLQSGLWDNVTGGVAQLSSGRLVIYINGLMPANESEGRNAIIEGINNIIPDATIYTDFEIDIRYFNGNQKTGKFDKVAFLGNQRWAFNYVTSGENFINVSSSSYNVFNVWENQSLSYGQVVSQVINYINQTKI